MDDKDQTKVDDQTTPEVDYQKDIHTPSLEDIFNEEADIEDAESVGDNPDDKKEEITPEPSEKPVETPVVEEKTTTPPIDEEKMADNIVDKVIEKLAPTDATKEEKKDLKDKLGEFEKKAKEEGKEVSNEEAWEFLINETKQGIKEELKNEVKQEVLKDLATEVETEEANAKKAAEDAAVAEEARKTELNNEWDRQLVTLENSGKIDKVLDPRNPNDRGVKQRVALFEALKEQTTEQEAAKQPVSLNLTEAFLTHYKDPFETPPGANAPVNGAKRNVTPTTPGDFAYEDIASTSLEDIMRSG